MRRNMIAHGLLADVEPRSDLVVVEALGHDLEDLPLTRREIIESGQGKTAGRVRRQKIAERLDQSLPRRLSIQ